jgi:hypothetical protein
MADVPQKRMLEVAEKAAPGVLTGFHAESWEIGANRDGQQPTWTNDFREQFQKRRGYDLLTYLPAMARYIVDDRQTTHRFLRDYRDTISDLIADFYGRMQKRANDRNCLVNVQSGHGTYPYPQMEGLKNLGRADLPQTEVWHLAEVMRCSDHFCDPTRTAASGAHIYGRQIVRAEALSGSGATSKPSDFRVALHTAFATGLNHAVLANTDHQPFEDKPGLHFSSNLNRHYPWWPMVEGYIGYLSRCQYLLQQGLFVADAAYFVGEGASRYVPGKQFLQPALPLGFDFDGINAEVLLTRASVKEGRLTLPDGLSYRYLVLCEPQCRTMSTAVLAKIKELVSAGVTVVGLPPQEAPGLGDRQASDKKLKALVADLWGASPGAKGESKFGKGRVIWGRPLADILAADKLVADVGATSGGLPFDMEWIHRRTEGSDIYFLANPTSKELEVEVSLRVTGRKPELFDPITGRALPLPEFIEKGGRTTMPMRFAANQAFFVVFRDGKAPAPKAAKNFPILKSLVEIAGPWSVAFDPAWLYPLPDATADGAKNTFVFSKLVDWTKRPEAGIQHYSGIATYSTTFSSPATSSPAYLALGEVQLMARVRVNGKDLGVVWCPPWRVEITSALKAGENQLEIEVANHWGNRLIGDAGLPETDRRTKTNLKLPATKPLFPSGLLGPVTLQSEQ